jgi:hypothetical protein
MKSIPKLKIQFLSLPRFIIVQQRRTYHFENNVKTILTSNSPLHLVSVKFTEERFGRQTQKMISYKNQLDEELQIFEKEFNSVAFVNENKEKDDTGSTPKSSPVETQPSISPQNLLLLEKINLHAIIFQDFFRQRFSVSIPTDFKLQLQMIGVIFYPVGIYLFTMVDLPADTDLVKSINSAMGALGLLGIAISMVGEFGRIKAIRNVEAEFLKVTGVGLTKAEEFGKQIKELDMLSRKYFQLIQSSSHGKKEEEESLSQIKQLHRQILESFPQLRKSLDECVKYM